MVTPSRLPNFVEIEGLPYIVIHDDDLLDIHSLYGCICRVTGEIKICTRGSPDRQWSDFFHEILHGIADDLGLKEDIIEPLSSRLFAVLRHNGFCFASLTTYETKHSCGCAEEQTESKSTTIRPSQSPEKIM